jgi:hypothetical protein
MKKLIIILPLLFILSCTENKTAKMFGGTEQIKIKPSEKIRGVTWSKENLWVLIEDTVSHKIYLQEKSSFGLLEGKIEFVK